MVKKFEYFRQSKKDKTKNKTYNKKDPGIEPVYDRRDDECAGGTIVELGGRVAVKDSDQSISGDKKEEDKDE